MASSSLKQPAVINTECFDYKWIQVINRAPAGTKRCRQALRSQNPCKEMGSCMQGA